MSGGESVKTATVGVLLDSVNSYFNRRIISELLATSEEFGLRLVFYFGGSLDRGRTSGNYSWVYSLPSPEVIDALIVLPNSIAPHNPLTATQSILDHIGDIPAYALFSRIEGLYSVDCDETKALSRMIDHLAGHHGYRNFTVLLGPDGDETVSRRRLLGITDRLAERGIELRASRIYPGDYSFESGKAAARKILSQEGDSPQIVISMNDQTVTALISEFQNNGIGVPQDIAVASFDEPDTNAILPCGISAVTFPISTMVADILARIRSDLQGATAYEASYAAYPAHFLHRASCGCSAWDEEKISREEGFQALDERIEDEELLRKAASLRHGLEDALEKTLSEHNPAYFADFIDATILSLRNSGELPTAVLDAFSTQWTVSLIKHQGVEDQSFLNALFIDAFRRILQAKIDVFRRVHQRDIGALDFYKRGHSILAEKISLHGSLTGIGASIPSLGIDRAQIVLISPYNPDLGEIRLEYRRGVPLSVPHGNYRTIHINNLLADGIASTPDPIMVFCLAHDNATYGYLTLAISDSQYDQYGLVQESLSHIIESAVTNDELSAHIRKLTRNNDDLSRISLIDEFTGLYNRRALYGRGKELFHAAIAEKKSSCVIFVDMDGLKKINDKWGHKEGDAAIKALADIFKKSFREMDLVVRYGGDEFVVIMADISRDAVDKALERVSANLSDYNGSQKSPWVLSASWGFVYNPPGEKVQSFEAIIEESDINLYRQKNLKKATLFQ